MLASKWGTLILAAVLVINIGSSSAWNIFPSSLTKASIGNFTREKLASLKNHRNRLIGEMTGTKAVVNSTRTTESETLVENLSSAAPTTQTPWTPSPTEEVDLSNSTLPLISRESLLQELQQILPNKDEVFNKINEVGDKLVEMKERLEPENFDPRLHLIESLMKSSHVTKVVNSIQDLGILKKRTGESIQARSGGDEDFVSDQEPVTKYHYHSKPVTASQIISDRMGYEAGYENGSPRSDEDGGDIMRKGYYLDDDEAVSDLLTAAGSQVARGHNGHSTSRGDHYGGGYGHGHGGDSGGGLSDPFTILGGLAFLTYLAMLIQQQMAAMPATPGRGRETLKMNEDTISKTIPLILAKLKLTDKHRLTSLATDLQKKMMSSPHHSPPPKIIVQSPIARKITTKTSPCSNLCQILGKLKKTLPTTNP
ncbi:uncharacterized protein LOC110858023 isoform X2 [Folsomia candida]|uniref:uncharacterized protein LOC110858023 isoform X2 n=1 Tax=Folsomia candida TaxID=158441 RepID=UPI001604AE2C|nr:uncharacterized protein LOC110858023 isoform X2 [Folsomia candida]